MRCDPATHPRACEFARWLAVLLGGGRPMLPTEVELAAKAAGFDWHFWRGTPVFEGIARLEVREAYPGYATKHYVLIDEGGE